MNEFAGIPDEELAVRCKRYWLEAWLHESGCVIGLVCGVLAAVVIFLSLVSVLDWSSGFSCWLAFLAFPFTALWTYLFIERVSRFRCRHALRELEYRYGWRPLTEYVADATQSISPNQIVLLLIGRTLPVGQNWWVCIRIDGTTSGTVETRFGPIEYKDRYTDFGSGRDPKQRFKIAKGELAPDVARRLAELAGSIQKQHTNVPATSVDGFPITCALVFGDASPVKMLSCNLAGIPENQRDQPHISLVRHAFAAGRALVNAHSYFGTVNQSGEIVIGEV